MSFEYFRKVKKLLDLRYSSVFILILAFLFLSLIEIIGIGLVAPYLSMIIDSFGSEEISPVVKNFYYFQELNEYEIIIAIGYVLILVFAAKFIFYLLINYKINKFCFDSGALVREKLMKTYQNFTYENFISRNSSEYIYAIQSKAVVFSQVIVLSSLRLISESIIFISISVFLLFQEPKILIFLFILFGIVFLGFNLFFKTRSLLYGERTNFHANLLQRYAQESFNGYKEIRVLNKEYFFFDQINKNAKLYADYATKNSLVNIIPRASVELILIIFIVSLVYYFQVNNMLESLLPILGMFGVAAIRLAPSFSELVSSLARLRFGKDTFDTIYSEVYDYHTHVLEEKPQIINSCEGFINLKIKNISFKYEDTNKQIITNLNLNLSKGEVIGIMGSSGSGKTTLIDIILGLLIPSDGEVWFNSKKIGNNLMRLTNCVAYIPQETFLIDGTLRSNIALGQDYEDIDDSKIFESLRMSRLLDFVNELPAGIDTKVGENGVKISGGQRQRISLARAFYYGRDFLIMDEATSALDTSTEAEIIEEVKYLKGVKTIILIAHRISTLKHCDKIYELNSGKLKIIK